MSAPRLSLQSISLGNQAQWMQQLGCAEPVNFKTLGDVVATERAIRADVVGRATVFHAGHTFEQGFANLHGLLVVRLLDAKSACVARTALKRIDGGAGDHL